MTKLDVLDGFESLRVAVGYEQDGKKLRRMPVGAEDLERCRPEYVEFAGWRTSTQGCRSLPDLPGGARRYLDLLQEHAGIPVRIVSVGPDRDSTFRA